MRSAGCWSTLLLPSLHSMRGQGAYSRGGRGVDKIARGSFRKVKFTKGPGVLCSLIVGEICLGFLDSQGGQIPPYEPPESVLCGCVDTHVDYHLSHNVHEGSSRCNRDSRHGCMGYPVEWGEGRGRGRGGRRGEDEVGGRRGGGRGGGR